MLRSVLASALPSILLLAACGSGGASGGGVGGSLDTQLAGALVSHGFTGAIEATLPQRLGRPVDPALADLGRHLFFDPLLSLHGDNSCAGCHSPANGFGDTQSISIGVDNNGIVGPDREGPRNQRKAPPVINAAFYRRLMLNGRFEAPSGDPFDNAQGFRFPEPEGTLQFQAHDPEVRTLLAAQGHIPPTELVEMAGFTGTAGTLGPTFDAFDNGLGTALPAPDHTGFRNHPIRSVVLARLNATPAYTALFSGAFNAGSPLPPGGVTFSMVGRALAEFQISLTFANAPIDRFARGEHTAMNPAQKRGALLFFGKARCIECHAVGGASYEMFSDFENHVLALPQIAPVFGVGTGNVRFDGLGQNEDFGAEQVTGNVADRYAFRTSPLRNCATQPAFFHNGCFTRLEDAVRHHLDALQSAITYDAVLAGLDPDLTVREGPILPVVGSLDARLTVPILLTPEELDDLVTFVRDGLLDPRALPANLCQLVPASLPSGLPVPPFQGCN